MTALKPNTTVLPSRALRLGEVGSYSVIPLTTSPALKTSSDLNTGSAQIFVAPALNLRVDVVIVSLSPEVQVTSLANLVEVTAQSRYAADVDALSSVNPVVDIGP